MKKNFVIHPFLFAIFPVLFLYSHNIAQALLSDTYLPAAILLCCSIFIFLFFILIVRNSHKAGIITSVIFVLFFAYGNIAGVIESSNAEGVTVGKDHYLLPIWGLLIGGSIFFTIKTKKDLTNLGRILNLFACFLVLFSLSKIILYEYQTRDTLAAHIQETGNSADNSNADTVMPQALRDIYYIILDGYASKSTLKDYYDHDNTEFLKFLTDRGFFIADKSFSNYAITGLSLSSSLNMEYVNYFSDMKYAGVLKNEMIANGKVIKFLKSKGYKYINFGSGHKPLENNKYADMQYRYQLGNEFQMVLFKMTMLRSTESLKKYLIGNEIKNRILFIFSRLETVPNIKGPKFILAHIVSPHPPFVFDREGNMPPEITLEVFGNEFAEKDAYINQLIFINKKVKELIDELLEKSRLAPIIILQADHGTLSSFGPHHYKDDASLGNWYRPNEYQLKERMRIFNACYLPPDGSDLLYETISPINTFRVIFNHYFDANFELLKDESFYSYFKARYKFYNVTDQVKHD
ncbi:hypothetical protein D1BOALGB6SA_9876 [Olavius sp. associated proteobacterium Delta 1]|nr:hypothetical protein D1BOALGB6SA_9876 [Olavius sp. associated proteobacterium Delta 1]